MDTGDWAVSEEVIYMLKQAGRYGALMLAAVLLLAMSACGAPAGKDDSGASGGQLQAAPETAEGLNDTEPVSPEDRPSADREETQNGEQSGDTDILVVYFSRTGEQYGVGVIEEGNTAVVAKMIAERTGADLFEIVPADDRYPVTYAELTDVAKQEQNANARPDYAGEVPDLAQYGTVFIGAPVWWGDWPMIMYTFFEENAGALAGKDLVPFSTHEGSGLSGFDRKLASAVPDSTVQDGLAVRGGDCQNDRGGVREKVGDWLSGLGY